MGSVSAVVLIGALAWTAATSLTSGNEVAPLDEAGRVISPAGSGSGDTSASTSTILSEVNVRKNTGGASSEGRFEFSNVQVTQQGTKATVTYDVIWTGEADPPSEIICSLGLFDADGYELLTGAGMTTHGFDISLESSGSVELEGVSATPARADFACRPG